MRKVDQNSQGGRLREFRRSLSYKGNKMTQKKFGKTLNVTDSYINLIELNRRSISIETLIKIAEEYNLSANWLLLGKGGMYMDTKKPEKWLLNTYVCPRCKTEWVDEWDCGVDDDCPTCGARHISPTESEDISDSQNWENNKDWQASS